MIKVEESAATEPVVESADAPKQREPVKVETSEISSVDEEVAGSIKGRRSSAGSTSKMAKLDEDLDVSLFICHETNTFSSFIDCNS